MTGAEARAAFAAALDGELDAEVQRAFEQALASDAELRAEFEQARSARQRALFGASWGPEDVRVDLLAGVQHKLRARSGGRFYRDRFAERSHLRGLHRMVLLSAAILIAVALWFAYQSL